MKKLIPLALAATLATGVAEAKQQTILAPITVSEEVSRAVVLCTNLSGQLVRMDSGGINCELSARSNLLIVVQHLTATYSIVMWTLTLANASLEAEVLSALTQSMQKTAKEYNGVPVYRRQGVEVLTLKE